MKYKARVCPQGFRVCVFASYPLIYLKSVLDKSWHGKNDHGLAGSSGVYLYRLQVGSMVKVQEMLRLE
ncbi:hypothetical protein GWO43_00775 [candidate division KSB1 bacterium]|nr:hypothetical protein [candidate division KSB1 bacterium]NIR68974.1 hypothetical protein [candidate division KSB1 bacterium]NIS22596.1 hypothetical protein [candidate division KSB1 bacterium]NIT69456.1 hypothetical protein [candidate division KSB1 bacterium]NIU23111.1 hypothetical protein [candidate division KSB1 bacterium]